MSTWTTIPDSSLEPGKPARSIDALALRDNPVAIAQGAPGAPRIDGAQGPAVEAGGLATDAAMVAWVLARTASAALGAIGTYAFLAGTTNARYVAGSTYAGSGLQYAGLSSADVSTPDDTKPFLSGTSPSGTWRAMGEADEGVTSAGRNITLFMRIS